MKGGNVRNFLSIVFGTVTHFAVCPPETTTGDLVARFLFGSIFGKISYMYVAKVLKGPEWMFLGASGGLLALFSHASLSIDATGRETDMLLMKGALVFELLRSGFHTWKSLNSGCVKSLSTIGHPAHFTGLVCGILG